MSCIIASCHENFWESNYLNQFPHGNGDVWHRCYTYWRQTCFRIYRESQALTSSQERKTQLCTLPLSPSFPVRGGISWEAPQKLVLEEILSYSYSQVMVRGNTLHLMSLPGALKEQQWGQHKETGGISCRTVLAFSHNPKYHSQQSLRASREWDACFLFPVLLSSTT